MKLKTVFILSAVAVTIIIGNAACSHSPSEAAPAGGVATNGVTPSVTNTTAAQVANPTPYPLETCVVDGMKLGSMGEPYVFVYQGQEIKLCCANCKPEFLRDAAKYMKKIQDAETSR
jgi:hypothetical protein